MVNQPELLGAIRRRVNTSSKKGVSHNVALMDRRYLLDMLDAKEVEFAHFREEVYERADAEGCLDISRWLQRRG